MAFTLINLETWARRDVYEHFLHEVPCSYSTTVHLDITNLKGCRLYPAMLWLLTQAVNQMPEFRTALTKEGLGIYDQMHPAYTIFHQESKTFSGIWTEFHPDYSEFRKAYEADAAKFSSVVKYAPKPDRPPNTFDISMVPWFSFTSFNLHVSGEGTHFLPIFTIGKYFDTGGKRLLPLAVQVHHAVCDGYHVGKLIERLQETISAFPHSDEGQT